MREIWIAVRVLLVIALAGQGLPAGVQAQGDVGMFEAKPFRILKRTNQEGNNEAHRISQ